MTTAEDIKKLASPKLTKIENVPEWNTSVWLRKLSVMDTRRAQELKLSDVLKRRKVNTILEAIDRWYCFVLSLCIVDENGKPIFTQEEVEGFDEIPFNFLCIEVAKVNDFDLDFDAAYDELKKIMASASTSN